MGETITREQFWAYNKWKLIERTGWSVEYVENLSIGHWSEWLNIQDYEDKKQEAIARDRQRNASHINQGK